MPGSTRLADLGWRASDARRAGGRAARTGRVAERSRGLRGSAYDARGRTATGGDPATGGGPMLVRLLRQHLRPYRGAVVVVLLLQVVQTIATLVLPSLNADLIDRGRRRRRHRLHPADRRASCWRSAWCRWPARSWRSTTAPARRWRSDGTCAAALFTHVQTFSAQEVAPLRCAVAHHPHHERRPAGPDGAAVRPDSHGDRADHARRRRRHGPARGRHALRPAARRGAGARRDDRADRAPDGAALPRHAEAHRPDQRRAARADRRHPRHPRVRPRAAGVRALRGRQHRPHGDVAAGRVG